MLGGEGDILTGGRVVRRWTRIAVCLLVIGLVMTLPTAYELQPRVAAEGTVIDRWGGLELGPFDGDLHKWSLWIEDAYPDLDEVTLFDIYASRNPGREATYMDVPTEVEVRDFGGVRCQLAHVWWGLRGGGWYFCLRSFGELPGEEEDVLEVFVVRAGGEAVTAVFGAGLAVLVVGVASLTLLELWKGGEDRRPEPRAWPR